MPFTISHAAAVLPLKRLHLPLAAMMIGSMSPDFAYFLPTSLERDSTHDLEGIMLFCWPVGLAVWLLYVHVLERPTIELLPAAWRERVTLSDRALSLKTLAKGSIAIILGAMTHVAWDAFTHANTPITNAFPIFYSRVFEYRGHGIRVFFLLQILSSVVGLFVLWLWALRLRHGAPRAHASRDSGFLTDRARVIAVLSLVATSCATALLAYTLNSGEAFENRVFRMLISGMAGWFIAWCAVAVLITRTARLVRGAQKG